MKSRILKALKDGKGEEFTCGKLAKSIGESARKVRTVLNELVEEGSITERSEARGPVTAKFYGAKKAAKKAAKRKAKKAPAKQATVEPESDVIPSPSKPISRMKKAELCEFIAQYSFKYEIDFLKEQKVGMLRNLASELPGSPMPSKVDEAEAEAVIDWDAYTKTQLIEAAETLGKKIDKRWGKAKLIKALLSDSDEPEPEPEPEPKAAKKAAKKRAATKPKTIKGVTYRQDPKKWLPKECPNCGEVTANTLKELEMLFGFRTPTGGNTIPQSQCRACRKESAKAAAAKKRAAAKPKPAKKAAKGKKRAAKKAAKGKKKAAKGRKTRKK